MTMLQTVETESFFEIEERKSRFLAFLVPIGQFEKRLRELRAEHRKAAHHVTAFRRIDADDHIEESAKDDGEPAGTSGMPVLKVLAGRNLINCGVIVVRYFGGTKLGAGGLARAYSGAAIKAVESADLIVWQRIVERVFTGRFEQSSDIEQKLSSLGLQVLDRQYHETGFDMKIRGPQTDVDLFSIFIREIDLYRT